MINDFYCKRRLRYKAAKCLINDILLDKFTDVGPDVNHG